MKKNFKNLTITTTIAAALIATSACSRKVNDADGWEADDDVAYCTDRQGKRVPDKHCSNGNGGGAFMMMYMGRGGYVPGYGKSSKYGSTRPAYGKSYSRSSSAFSSSRSYSGGSVSRGFSGSSASGFSAGG